MVLLIDKEEFASMPAVVTDPDAPPGLLLGGGVVEPDPWSRTLHLLANVHTDRAGIHQAEDEVSPGRVRPRQPGSGSARCVTEHAQNPRARPRTGFETRDRWLPRGELADGMFFPRQSGPSSESHPRLVAMPESLVAATRRRRGKGSMPCA